MKITYNDEEIEYKGGGWECIVAGIWGLLVILAFISALYLVAAGLLSLLWDLLWGCLCFFLLFVVALLAIGLVATLVGWIVMKVKFLFLGAAVKAITKAESKGEKEC